MTASADDTRTDVVKALHRAFNDRDRDALLACLREDVTWHVEGEHPMAGTYKGADGLWDGHFAPLWASPARYEDHDVRDHGDHVVAFAEVFHNFGEGERGYETVEVLRVDGGRVAERWAFTSGQGELDAFFTRGCAAAAEQE